MLQGRDFAERDVLMEKNRIETEKDKKNVSFAYGISIFNIETDSATKYIFARADEEMYRCKKRQRAKN